MSHAVEVEIERNYAAFKDMLPKLLSNAEGQYALLHNQQLEGIFPTPGEAERAGYAQFKNQQYSIQLVSETPVDLGFYSYALAQG
ncbi:MAG: hypothetical protein ACK40O_00470 [Allosphingosinicella sp.]